MFNMYIKNLQNLPTGSKLNLFFYPMSTSPNSLVVSGFSSGRFTRQTQAQDSFVEIVLFPTFETDVRLEKKRGLCKQRILYIRFFHSK